QTIYLQVRARYMFWNLHDDIELTGNIHA
ncbi:MAG: hypothetical protein Q619_VDC00031G0001, partial [Veillonella dispar DORA_11]